MGIPIKIVNVVATAALDHFYDLDTLRKDFPDEIIHDPDIYRGRVAYFKSKHMQGKVTIFPSGKMISIGTTSVNKASHELRLVAETLKAKLRGQPKTQNIVATATLGFEVDLLNFVPSRAMNVIYEPEQFPGAIIRIPLNEKDVVASTLLFASGKIICTGLKNLEQVHEAIRRLLNEAVRARLSVSIAAHF